MHCGKRAKASYGKTNDHITAASIVRTPISPQKSTQTRRLKGVVPKKVGVGETLKGIKMTYTGIKSSAIAAPNLEPAVCV